MEHIPPNDVRPYDTMRESPHPLALALAGALHAVAEEARGVALVLGAGSGRNVAPLREIGARVDILEEDSVRAEAASRRFRDDPGVRIAHGSYAAPHILQRSYTGVLSTHALLHGTSQGLAQSIAALAEIVEPGGSVMLTLGSTRDPRCAHGLRIDERSWAPTDGPEAGVPHVYCDEAAARALLSPQFEIVSLREVEAGELVGRWAHEADERIVHWFACGRRKAR